MSVSASDVRHVAALARLALPEERVAPLADELNRILEHMTVLQQVPPLEVSGAPPTPGTLREDVPAPVPLAAPIAAFAPAERDGFFLVPRLATHE
jgi:aspartyl-tRNA(Asn)/glutamyl-tRNA(Gln) amidotransferase subunit C